MISDILKFRRTDRSATSPRPASRRSGDQVPPAEPLSEEAVDSATIPLVPRDLAHLPTQRWHWSARRRMAQDHPFGRIAQMEANLESLVAELETEVDRLVACSERLLDGKSKP